MIITIKGKECELGFTFNSFKYMQEFDIKALDEIESKPFKVVPMLEMLLIGGVNHNPKVKFNMTDVELFLEDFMLEGSLPELLELLMGLLQESNFFKALQKKTEK